MSRLLLPIGLALLLPAGTAAQQVQGRVVDDEDGAGVAGATVALEDTLGRVVREVVSAEGGHFRLWHTAPGSYRLSAERIGYATAEGEPIRLDSAEVVEVVVRLRPQAVVLDPIRVVARREIKRGTVDEFYDRMDRLADRGHFLTREDIEATNARRPSTAVSWAPGTWVTPSSTFAWTIQLMSYGRVCTPAIYLNGHELRHDWMALDDMTMVDRIEGVEVYRGHFVPDTYAQSDESWGCGVILVWTRTDTDPRFVFRWGRALLFGALGGVALGLGLLF